MSFFEFPNTRTYDSDLGFIIKWIDETQPNIEDLDEWRLHHEAEYNQLKNIVEGLQNSLIDVIVPWNSSIAYKIYSIVEYLGSNYIAIQDVPVGAMITDTNYWVQANTVIAQINAIGNTVSEVDARYPRRTYHRPEDYGAVVDDVNIDNAPFIRQAILDAINDKGIVLLSEGTYYTHSSIVIDQRCFCVNIFGTGISSHGTHGTTIRYDGTGIALHFSCGMWGCNVEGFMIRCDNYPSTCLRFSKDDDPNNTNLTTRCQFTDIMLFFRYHGMEMATCAYDWFHNLSVMADSDHNDANRVGVTLENDANTPTDNNIEYLNFVNSRVVCRNTTDGTGFIIKNGTHLGMYDMDITDCNIGIDMTARSGLDLGFIDFIDIDLARVHFGININLDNQALQNFLVRQLAFTATSDVTANDRVIKINRINGGINYNCRMKAEDITLRSGFNTMTYFVEADTNTMADGSCEFTFNGTNFVPKLSLGTRRGTNPYFCTWGNEGALTSVDLNDYVHAGLQYQRFTAACTNSPGFDAMIVNYTNPYCTTQIAIPTASGGTLAFRTYIASSQTWSAWQKMAKQ